ncbi:toprim domain-containing protein [Bacillus atrophaeus]|uniref:toprim domain-containing protein n=1 Tax=Bacillus atrophaeus TaxID=1452 RepID=UPI0009EEDDB4|nr:toprim domain-containing protein [Bacillus atrophaeus]
MILDDLQKVIIVEGKSDKQKIKSVLNESACIVCTNGTVGQTKLEELADQLYDKDVYILVDADESGEKLRKQLKRELPDACHLYIDRTFKEVAAAPSRHIASVLLRANINVHTNFLDG